MKLCLSTCGLAITFLIADMYMTFNADKSGAKDNFVRLLSAEQRRRYGNIIAERRNIYFTSYIVGLALSVVFIVLTRNLERTRWFSTGIICTVGGITLLVNYLCYILAPKSDYMIMHLEGKAQRAAWLELYRYMQVKYHTGLLFGIIAAMLLAKATC